MSADDRVRLAPLDCRAGDADELVTKKGFYYTLGTKCVTPVK